MTVFNSVKFLGAALLATAMGSTSALAQNSEPVLGDASSGQTKSNVCVACHGTSGNESVLPDVPNIGGQGEKYLLKQLLEIKNDIRPVPLMKPFVDPMSEQDLADVAAYYSGLPDPLGAVEAEKRELGEALYRAGNGAIGVPACAACHEPDGSGNAPAGYPALSGQDVAYTELQLRAFRAGTRVNDDAAVMRTITERLTDTEIAALASFVSGLR